VDHLVLPPDQSLKIMSSENQRLQNPGWKKWGPYLTDRQWGTVREDYSEHGNAWDYTTHDMARSKAYRWGEEGIGGISDDQQLLCFAIGLWNKKDPIIKERYFGLTGSEGNHGEDVKEYYFYLDSTPTHSYMKMLYKYPQQEYPYAWLVEENRRRSRTEPEFELIETGIFKDNKYFDVFVEYAKQSEDDILVKITVHNRGEEKEAIHVLPTMWFRNTWSWGYDNYKPRLFVTGAENVTAEHVILGNYQLYCDNNPLLIFTDNETNTKYLYNHDDGKKYCKDGINNYLVNGNINAINKDRTGTKASADYNITVEGNNHVEIRLRLTKDILAKPFSDYDKLFNVRVKEADDFYKDLQKEISDMDARLVQRQALAGMLWSKQFYLFNAKQWLNGDPALPAPSSVRKQGRNNGWKHLNNADIISMPDKWEYPWYAAWDLAFHCIPLALVDAEFAKQQLLLITRQGYMHPNGQLPAYEWNFGDVNPPVHAWAAYFVYLVEKQLHGTEDIDFLKSVFHKLLLNFTWWVNRKDPKGHNVFDGGFLGLDNIGAFDRSAPLPTGGHLEQADGTAWMALYCQNMLTIALELAVLDPVYEEMAAKFLEQFYWIAAAINGNENADQKMWDEEENFFYDLLCLPDGSSFRLKIRSMVGLLPLCAATVFDNQVYERFPALIKHIHSFLSQHPELKLNMTTRNENGMALLSIMDEKKLRAILSKMLDSDEFFSSYGIRSVSKYHAQHPYVLHADGQEFRVDYWPAESQNNMFGGNSNWRGPIWFPINALIIRSLFHLYEYYGDAFKVECPTGSGQLMNLYEVGEEISRKLTSIFLRDANQQRPLYGDNETFQNELYWRDNILFYEYFHGDNGTGLGASHQTGWSGFVAMLIHLKTFHWKK
jgi:hypothetical protein